MDNFNNRSGKSGIDPLNQDIDIAKLATAISMQLNKDIPAAQVQRAVERYNKSFFPVVRTTNYTFSATSAYSGLQAINIDSSYGFFCTGIAGLQSSTDYNAFVSAVQLNNGYNFLPESMPFVYLTRYTCKPLDFCMYVPPISQIQTNIQNGSTTAAATFYVSYFGYKLPTEFINMLTGGK